MVSIDSDAGGMAGGDGGGVVKRMVTWTSRAADVESAWQKAVTGCFPGCSAGDRVAIVAVVFLSNGGEGFKRQPRRQISVSQLSCGVLF